MTGDRTPTGDLRERLAGSHEDVDCPAWELATGLESMLNAAEKRAEEAERQRDAALAAVQRVRDLHARDDSSPHGPWCGVCLAPWPCRTRLATEPAPPKETRPVGHTGGNAEDCPVCRPSIDQPGGVLYPWTCPGPTRKETPK